MEVCFGEGPSILNVVGALLEGTETLAEKIVLTSDMFGGFLSIIIWQLLGEDAVILSGPHTLDFEEAINNSTLKFDLISPGLKESSTYSVFVLGSVCLLTVFCGWVVPGYEKINDVELIPVTLYLRVFEIVGSTGLDADPFIVSSQEA